jgi:hypothetical protein
MAKPPFPGGKAAPKPRSGPAVKTPELPPEDSVLMAQLRERRDLAIARRTVVQNQITKGELIPREDVKRVLGRVSVSWRATIPESSYSSAPLILAVLEGKDPALDSRLRLLMDDEAYAAGGNINRAMEKWLKSREVRAGGDGAK